MKNFSLQVQSPNHLGFVAKLMSCETKALETIRNFQSIKITFTLYDCGVILFAVCHCLFYHKRKRKWLYCYFFFFNFWIMKLHCHIWHQQWWTFLINLYTKTIVSFVSNLCFSELKMFCDFSWIWTNQCYFGFVKVGRFSEVNPFWNCNFFNSPFHFTFSRLSSGNLFSTFYLLST